MPPKRLDELLKSPKVGSLGDIVRHAHEVGALTGAILSSLPEEAREGLVAVNVRDDGTLVAICRSPAWAARFRFDEVLMLEAARKHGAVVDRLVVRVVRHDGGP